MWTRWPTSSWSMLDCWRSEYRISHTFPYYPQDSRLEVSRRLSCDFVSLGVVRRLRRPPVILKVNCPEGARESGLGHWVLSHRWERTSPPAGGEIFPLIKKYLPEMAAPSQPKAPAGSSAPHWRRCTGRSPPEPDTAPELGRSSKSHRYRCAA